MSILAVEMIQWVWSLLFKCDNLSSGPNQPSEKQHAVAPLCNLTTGGSRDMQSPGAHRPVSFAN